MGVGAIQRRCNQIWCGVKVPLGCLGLGFRGFGFGVPGVGLGFRAIPHARAWFRVSESHEQLGCSVLAA